MGRPKHRDQFLDALREAGGSISNAAFKTRLGWEGDRYDKIKAELDAEGLIIRGKGRGGTVSIAEIDQNFPNDGTPAPPIPLVSSQIQNNVDSNAVAELALYDPAKLQLEENWKDKHKLYDFHVENSAMLGRRDTGGSWSRPDLVVIGSKKYEFLREKVFELHTFEIKPATDVTIKGVLEALSHREAATRAYVLYHTAGQDFTVENFSERSRIENLAARHGVGVYIAKTISDFSQWIEIVPAQRATPDLDSVEQFIISNLSKDAQSQIRKWF